MISTIPLNQLSTDELVREYPKAYAAIRAMSDFANSFTADNKAFAELFSREHRTLQQSMLKAMLTVIERMAEPDYRTDPRNEQSAKVCQQLIEGFKTQVPNDQTDFKPSQWLGCI